MCYTIRMPMHMGRKLPPFKEKKKSYPVLEANGIPLGMKIRYTRVSRYTGLPMDTEYGTIIGDNPDGSLSISSDGIRAARIEECEYFEQQYGPRGGKKQDNECWFPLSDLCTRATMGK